MTKANTIIADLRETCEELCCAVEASPDPTAIDWSKFRERLALLLQKLGPILLPLIISFLSGTNPTTKE